MTKVVIANRRYSNWNRGQNRPGSWVTIWQYDGKDIPSDIPLTDRAISHWQKFKTAMNTATFRGDSMKDTLSINDIKSILSACKRDKATIYGNRMGDLIGYKIK